MATQKIGPSFKCGSLVLKRGKEVQTFAQDLLKETEQHVADFIPERILKMDKLLKEHFSDLDLTRYHSDLGIAPYVLKQHVISFEVNNSQSIHDGQISGKKRKIDEEDIASHQVVIPCNKKLVSLIELLKDEIRLLIETCSRVQMWIQLLIPRIEDGNNFGVSIQEEILSEVNRIQTDSSGYLDQISRYYITRGKLLSKIAKYPFLEDYLHSVNEIDEKEFLSLRHNCTEIRNHYLLLLDLISKNYEKIKRPRTSNTESMY